MTYKHGVYVEESVTIMPIAKMSNLGVQVVVGVGPINLVANPANAVNVPLLCSSVEEAQKAVGFSRECNWSDYTLCQSIDASFNKYKVAPIIVINVLDPIKHKTSVIQTAIDVVNKVAKIPTFGVLLESIVVKPTAEGVALVNGKDYVATFDEKGLVQIALTTAGSGAALNKVYIAFDKIDPSKVVATDIIGSNINGVETGLELIRQIYPKFGVNAGLIIAPNWSKEPSVAAVMESKCKNINGCFSSDCIVDIESKTTTTYANVETAKNLLGVSSGHTIAFWPMWKEDEKIYNLSAIAAAKMLANDMENDEVPYKSPSNKSLNNGYACLEDGTKVLLDQEQANEINGIGVCTAINLRGFKLWGNNTVAFPKIVDPKDRWISIRRFFTWWGNRFVNTYMERIDGNASRRMVESIVDDENIICNGYVARGYCAGAKIVFDFVKSDVVNGKLSFVQKIGAYPPSEVIENHIECDVSMLLAEFGGEK